MGQEERPCPVEEEGSAEAARRAPILGQRPERGALGSDWLGSPSLFSCFFLHELLLLFFVFALLTFCLLSWFLSLFFSLSHTHGHLSLLVSHHLSSSPPLSPALACLHTQHVECLFPELQLLRFLDYYWLSQSFRPCLKSVTVDVVCAAGLCGACSLNADFVRSHGAFHLVPAEVKPTIPLCSECI